MSDLTKREDRTESAVERQLANRKPRKSQSKSLAKTEAGSRKLSVPSRGDIAAQREAASQQLTNQEELDLKTAQANREAELREGMAQAVNAGSELAMQDFTEQVLVGKGYESTMASLKEAHGDPANFRQADTARSKATASVDVSGVFSSFCADNGINLSA